MRFKKTIISLIVIIVVSVIVVNFFKKEETEYNTSQVSIGNLVQTVSEVGTVKSSKELELSFLQTGKIASTSIEVGDKVVAEQILVELDHDSLDIQMQEALAGLEVAKTNLNKLLSGATDEEVAVKQASLDQAETAYESAQRELEKTENTVNQNQTQLEKKLADLQTDDVDSMTPQEQLLIIAQTALDNAEKTYQQAIDNVQNLTLINIDDELSAANTALDAIDKVMEDDDIEGVFSVQDIAYINKTNTAYNQGSKLLKTAQSSFALAKNSKTEDNIQTAINDCLACLDKVFESLNYCYNALENTITSYDFSQTELDAFKTTISTQLTTISTGISGLQTHKQNLDDAILNYDNVILEKENSLIKAQVDLADAINTAQDNLDQSITSGEQQLTSAQTKVDSAFEALNLAQAQMQEILSVAQDYDVALNQAQIKQAEANVELIAEQIEESIIRAPIDGIITDLAYEVGERVLANTTVVSVLAENNFEIEVDISESDIVKIEKDDEVIITLDSFGDDIEFLGKVFFIEPAETIIQDVIYYKVKVEFIASDNFSIYADKIKSGMTANLTIDTEEKENVLIIPTRAIIDNGDEGKFVRILVDGELQEIKVETGLRGDDGLIEILSGVEEGEVVVVSVKN